MTAAAQLNAGQGGSEVFDLLQDGVAVFDPEGVLVSANRSFRAANAAIAEFLEPGVSWDMLLREAEAKAGYPPELCADLGRVEEALADDPEAGAVFDARLTSGDRFRLRLDALPDGGFVLVQSPVPEPDAAGDALHEVESLLVKVLEASPVSLTMSRIGDGHVIYRSAAATELLGTAKSSLAHFARRAERADFITALLPDGRVDDMRITGVRADGSEFPAQVSARLIEYGGEEVIVSSIEDLSEELAIQAELERSREQVFQAEKMSALGELLAGVAHELNNPLSIVVGNAGILREDLKDTPHVARVEKLVAAAERCVAIARTFLSMARERPLDLTEENIEDLVDVALEATAPLAQASGVEVLFDAPDPLPAVVADRVQIAQVLINLVTNAVHALGDAGGGSLVTISARQSAPDAVTVRVADDGPGIPPEIRGRIFDPLFTTKPPGKGTGVGLAFCMRVVTAHKGRLAFEPVEPTGASFIFTLPAASAG